ncbi:MAG TPA: DUF1592 domain-containing protein, partial [Marinagarivorans sp.]
MRRSLFLAFSATMLSACVATPNDESSSSSTAASSEPTASSSAATQSSNPASSSSAPNMGSSSSSAALTFPAGDASRGRIYYTDSYKNDALNCTTCHGEDGNGTVAKITAGKASYNFSKDELGDMPLAEYIYRYMPDAADLGRCDEQCAADIAAYINSWTTQSSSSAPSLVYKGNICDDRITYGARQLKLLTRNEYQNTMEDLVGINFEVSKNLPDDTYIHGFSNNIGASVTQVHVDSYLTSAEEIASWSKARGFEGVVDCNGLSPEQCAQAFTSGFAKNAFRRPLSKDEVTAITSLFGDGFTDGDVNNGIEMALTSVLSAPAFLYRSEQGVAVSQGEYDGSQYEFTGTVTELKATDLQHNFGEPGDLDGAWKVRSRDRQEAKLEKHLSYTGAGTLMEITVKGTTIGGTVPKMTVAVNSFSHEVLVDWDEYRTIKVYFPGITGHHGTRIALDIRSQNYDESYIEVHTINYGEAALLANAPDLDAYALTPYEIATYLAYTYTGSTPDATLMAAAENNLLSSDEQIAEQVGRLLESPRAKAHLGDFAAQWLGTDDALTEAKDPAKYPELTEQIRQAMVQEVRELFAHVALDDSQSIEQFFAADYTFVNATLADYYGLSGVNGSGFTKVNGGATRGGILTTGAFMTAYGNNDETSPIRRAAAVRERLLCQDIPPPPPGVVVDREAAALELATRWEAGEISNRERYHELTKEGSCQSCHKEIINPLGFGMEDYDTIGRHQHIDRNGLMVDATGELIGLSTVGDGGQLSFFGAKELSHSLAELDTAKHCFAQNLFRFAMGTGQAVIDENNEDLGALTEQERLDYSCSIDDITAAMIAADNNPKE